jgi:hypothetical protein
MQGVIWALFAEFLRTWKLSVGVKMLIRLSMALLLSLLVSVPSHAQFARRLIEHRMESNAAGFVSCKADAARICPGVADDGQQRQCLKLHQSELSIGCARELKKLETK